MKGGEREMEGGNKPLSRARTGDQEENDYKEKKKVKKARKGRCLSSLDIKLDRPLRELDPVKLKKEIRRWARAVACYARQLSRTISGRRSFSSSSSKDNDAAVTSIATVSPR
ncbi:hypothetical protein KSP40_PGU001246 [Platanthera guangdongensis]|uniref:Uncharacterized protein n=1 Tax=Platanthera guangdongensis TaxID=2320717 RepID=A0ABR2MS14_9ASPA